MNNYTFIYPPTVSWNEPIFQRPHQLMNEFAKQGYTSIFCNLQNDGKGNYFFLNSNLCICNDLEYTMNDPYIQNKIKTSKKVFWLTYPPSIEYKKYVNPDIFVFDYIDEISDEFMFWNTKSHECMKDSDIIFTTSSRLYETTSVNYNSKTFMAKNAADVNNFFKEPTEIPNEIKYIRTHYKYIIGFMGTIHSWIDFEFVNKMAKLTPEWAYVFIGPKYCKTPLLDNQINIIYLGSKNYNILVNYVKSFDAAIIPFQIRNMTNAANPIKMYEFMAAGIPVVATPIKECIELMPYIKIASTPEEGIKKLESAINNSPIEKASYIELAKNNSWTTRVKDIIGRLEAIKNV